LENEGNEGDDGVMVNLIVNPDFKLAWIEKKALGMARKRPSFGISERKDCGEEGAE
jgi:hypothetical protein